MLLGADADGQRRHIFPVTGAKGIVGFLDAAIAAPPRGDRQAAGVGLLRIYQNHQDVLADSETDELTGLLNRKTFDAAFNRLTPLEAPRRAGAARFQRIDRRRPADPMQPRWLAVMDIDFFKRINDRFGHARGDEVLAAMARLMRDSFRESDRLFRCGGEEFVVILEPTDGRYVRGILERFRRAVEAHDFSGAGLVTMSMGYTRLATDVRQSKYLNNVVEQDHRAIKGRTRPILGFKTCRCARILLAGIELAHMIAKGQMKCARGTHPSSADQFYDLAS